MRSMMLGLLVVLSSGCGSSDSEGTQGTGGTGGGKSWTCTLSGQCNVVHVSLTSQNPTVAQSADTDCFLTSLRDRKVGHYAISQQAAYYSVTGYVDVLADGTVVRWSSSVDDTGHSSSTAPTHFELKDTAYFDGCLTTQSDSERYKCLVEYTLGEVTSDPVCPST